MSPRSVDQGSRRARLGAHWPNLGPQTLPPPLIDRVLHLPEQHGGTAFRARVWRTAGNVVAELTEIPSNLGLPIVVAFPQAAAAVRTLLDEHSTWTWVEYWPERAIASLLLESIHVPARHLRSGHPSGRWLRTPLSWSQFLRLLGVPIHLPDDEPN